MHITSRFHKLELCMQGHIIIMTEADVGEGVLNQSGFHNSMFKYLSSQAEIWHHLFCQEVQTIKP